MLHWNTCAVCVCSPYVYMYIFVVWWIVLQWFPRASWFWCTTKCIYLIDLFDIPPPGYIPDWIIQSYTCSMLVWSSMKYAVAFCKYWHRIAWLLIPRLLRYRPDWCTKRTVSTLVWHVTKFSINTSANCSWKKSWQISTSPPEHFVSKFPENSTLCWRNVLSFMNISTST